MKKDVFVKIQLAVKRLIMANRDELQSKVDTYNSLYEMCKNFKTIEDLMAAILISKNKAYDSLKKLDEMQKQYPKRKEQ